MNRAERRRKGIKEKPVAIPCTEETLAEIRLSAAKEIRNEFIAMFLVSAYDIGDFKSYPNRMGKMDRLIRVLNRRLDAIPDIMDYTFVKDIIQETKEKTEIYIDIDANTELYLNGHTKQSKQLTMNRVTMENLIKESKLNSFAPYLAVFTLSLHEVFHMVSTDDNDCILNKIINKIENNIDAIGTKCAEIDFSTFRSILKDELNIELD